MSSDLSALFTKENLEAIGKDFVEQTKSRLKDHWDNYPEQVKKDVEATAKFAAELALEISTGQAVGEKFDRKQRALRSQMANIQIVGQFEFKLLVEEILDTAGRLAGTFFQKALVAALSGGLKL